MRFELIVDGEESAVQATLAALLGFQSADIDTIRSGVSQILQKVETLAMNEAERAAAFEQRLTMIAANTTSSAAAADVIKDGIVALKLELDQVLTEAGVPAATEDSILARLDIMGESTGQLKTFLEATATGFSRPSAPPEPPPVAPPVIPDPVPTT